MTANALNPTAVNHAAAFGAGPPGAAKASGPLAGFEALVAALFPQTDLAIAPQTPAVAAVAAAAATTNPGSLLQTTETASVDGDASAEPMVETAEAADVVTEGVDLDLDAAAALAASLTQPQQAPVAETTAVPATPDTASDTALAASTKPAGKAAFALSTHANPRAALSGKSELKAEVAPETDATDVVTTTDEDASLDGPRRAAVKTEDAPDTDKPAPPAWGRDKAPGAPAAPALANANPKANLAEKAEVAALPDVQVVETAAATAGAVEVAETAQPAVATAPLADLEPAAAPVATPATKPAKAERGKPASDAAAVSDLKAPDATDKPVTARPVTAAPKAPSADGDAAAPATAEAKAAPDHAEGQPAAETRSASAQPATPSVNSAHAVRGAPETVANLAAQIIKKLDARSTRFDVELDPAGLGKVNVRVEIGAHGAITAAMSFDNPQAAQELRSRAAELQRALEQAGFNLTEAIKFDVASDRGHQQHQAWQDQGETNGGAFRGQAFRAALDTADDAASAAMNGALRLRRGVTAGLDVRV